MASLAIMAIAKYAGVAAGTWGWFAASAIGVAADYFVAQSISPDVPDTRSEGPSLTDLTVQSSAYGATIPDFWGSYRTAGNVIWSTGLIEQRHEETTVYETGGKGGSSQTSTHTEVWYTYSASFAIGLGSAITGIRRIWADGKLIYDKTDSSEIPDQTVSEALNATIYLGSESQEPDPLIESYEEVGNVPAYRGLSYSILTLELEKYGNRIPNIEVEVCNTVTTDDWTGDIGDIWQNGDGQVQAITVHDGNLVGAISHYNAPTYSHRIQIYDGISPVELYSFPITLTNPGTHVCSMAMGGDKFVVLEWSWINLVNVRILDSSGVLINAFGLANSPSSTGYSVSVAATPDRIAVSCGSSGGRIQIYTYDGYLIEEWSLHPTYGPLLTSIDGDLLIYDISVDQELFRMVGFSSTVREQLDDFSISANELEIWQDNVVTITRTLAGAGLLDKTAYHVYDDISPQNSTTYKQLSSYENGSTDPETLDTIISDLFDMASLDPADYDVTDLSSIDVPGFAKSKPMAIRAALQPLMRGYQFDIAEIDDKLVCVTKGGASIATIPEDDLAARESESGEIDTLKSGRMSELELPQQVVIKYRDVNTDYQIGSQSARRQVTLSDAEQTLNVPLAMTATQAKQMAERILSSAWAGRTPYELSVGPEYAKLTPTDVITAKGFQMRIVQLGFAMPGLLSINAVSEETAAFTSTATADTPFVPPNTLEGSGGPTAGYLLNLPPLREVDSNGGFYFVGVGFKDAWRGGAIYISRDNGATYSPLAVVLTPATVGYATDALADGPTTIRDQGNTVNIKLITPDATLSDITEAQAFVGLVNTAAIGADGRWEIITFQDITLEADGTYTLTSLIRGRRGTEHATGSHAINDQFVLLTGGGIVRVPLSDDDINTEYLYKVVTFDSFVQDVAAVSFTSTGEAYSCFAPCHIKGVRDGSDNLTITWLRRARLNGAWRDYVDVPLYEAAESYDVDILDGSTVKRTLTATDDQTGVTYTAAQQTTDFGSPQSSVDIIVYQRSDIIGRGHGAAATI